MKKWLTMNSITMKKLIQNNKVGYSKKWKKRKINKEINRKDKISNLMINLIKCLKISDKIHKCNLTNKEKSFNKNKKDKNSKYKINKKNKMRTIKIR